MSNPIIVTVRYTVKDGKREEFYRHIVEQGIDTASRAEDGNRKYDYYYPTDSEQDLCLLELWDSREAQKIHGTTAHYQKLSDLKATYVTNAEIHIYDLAE